MKKIDFLLTLILSVLLFSCSNNDDDLGQESLTLRSSSANYYIVASVVNATTISYTATIENKTTLPITYNNVYIYLKFADNINGPSLVGESSVLLGTITVAPNSVFNKTGTIKTITKEYNSRGGIVIFKNPEFSVQQGLGLLE